jgi:pimeloyl-ACP methyl ester carboxylesterase
MSHGATLASWSRRVQTISSPGCSARHAAAEKRIVSAVIDGPKTMPSAPAPSSRATEARAWSTSASVRSAAWNAPPWLAEWPERIHAAISSMASSTIWVPAAPSRRAQPSERPGKRVRCIGADPSHRVPCRAMPQAAVDGISLFYERRGSGEPLLLIQGMSGTHLAWGDAFLAGLGDDLDVVAYDHRGVGESTPQSDSFTIAQLADDAAGLLDALEWETAHVVGISMGGMVAQELALRHPGRIRTLTLGCTYPGGAEAELADPELIQELAGALLSGDRERALRTGFKANLSAAHVADEAHWEPFHAMATALPVAVPLIMLQMQAVMGHDTSARLASIAVPTLVVHGTEDRMLPVVNGELIARLIPSARLELLEGVGHMFWWEEPERSAALVRSHVVG